MWRDALSPDLAAMFLNCVLRHLFDSQGYIACAINFGFIGIPKAIADINRVTSILSEDRLNLYLHQISSQTHGRAQGNIDLIPFPQCAAANIESPRRLSRTAENVIIALIPKIRVYQHRIASHRLRRALPCR